MPRKETTYKSAEEEIFEANLPGYIAESLRIFGERMRDPVYAALAFGPATLERAAERIPWVIRNLGVKGGSKGIEVVSPAFEKALTGVEKASSFGILAEVKAGSKYLDLLEIGLPKKMISKGIGSEMYAKAFEYARKRGLGIRTEAPTEASVKVFDRLGVPYKFKEGSLVVEPKALSLGKYSVPNQVRVPGPKSRRYQSR